MNSLHWKTADGLNIEGKHWPVAKARAVLSIVHGMGEHIQRYEAMAAFYNQAGIAVLGNDHRGHGQSEGKRGHIPAYSALLDEVEQLIGESAKRYPGIPHFLFGQSLGGNVVLNYLIRRRPALSGVIASSPWIRLAFRPDPISIMAGKLLRNLYPTFTQPTRLKPEHLSTDQAVGTAYAADPLVHDRITAAMGTAMLEAADFLDTYTGSIDLPLLIMHGTADQIVSPEASRAFAERVQGPVHYVSWEGSYHELHNEANKGEVMQTTLHWMQDKI